MDRTTITYVEYKIDTDLPARAVREIAKRHDIWDYLAVVAEEPPRILENSKGVTVIFGPFEKCQKCVEDFLVDFEKTTATLDKIVEDIEKEVRRLEALNSDLHLLQSEQEDDNKNQNALAACGIEVIS